MTVTQQLSLIDSSGPRHQAAAGEVRLLVFNAQHASPGRARRQAEWIAAQEAADLLVISEVGSGPGGAALIGALTERGYTSVLAPGASFAGYGTILASREVGLTAIPSGIKVLPHRGPAATFTLAGERIGLLGLYVPSRGPKERRNEDKRAFQRAVTAALPGFPAQFGGPVIVAGDLNVVEPGHIPHHAVFGDWEYDFYRSFAGAGLTDAYRALHPGRPRPQLVRPQRPGLPFRPCLRHDPARWPYPQLSLPARTPGAGRHRPCRHDPRPRADSSK